MLRQKQEWNTSGKKALNMNHMYFMDNLKLCGKNELIKLTN